MGSFRKKATKALRSAKSWFKGKGVKSPSSVDLASELSVREDSGVSICTTGLSKGTGIEDGPALFEESQEEASGGTQVVQPGQAPMRRVKSYPWGSLASWDDIPALKLVKSFARLPAHHARDSSLEDWSPRPAKRMPSSSDQDSVPEPPCPSLTPREFSCLHKVDDMTSCQETSFTFTPNHVQEVCS